MEKRGEVVSVVGREIAIKLRKMAESIEHDNEADGVGFHVFIYDEFDQREVKDCELFDNLHEALCFHNSAWRRGESSYLNLHAEDMRIDVMSKRN